MNNLRDLHSRTCTYSMHGLEVVFEPVNVLECKYIPRRIRRKRRGLNKKLGSWFSSFGQADEISTRKMGNSSIILGLEFFRVAYIRCRMGEWRRSTMKGPISGVNQFLLPRFGALGSPYWRPIPEWLYSMENQSRELFWCWIFGSKLGGLGWICREF